MGGVSLETGAKIRSRFGGPAGLLETMQFGAQPSDNSDAEHWAPIFAPFPSAW